MRQLGGALHDDPPDTVPPIGARRIDLEPCRGAQRGADAVGEPRGLGRAPAAHGDDREPAERRVAELGAEAELVRVEGGEILAHHGLERVVRRVLRLDDERAARADALGGGPQQGQGPLARSEVGDAQELVGRHERDRKSTRLNSSHITISYAVFCLKKKKKENKNNRMTVKVSIYDIDTHYMYRVVMVF